MKPELQRIYESMKDEAPRSCLEPYRDVILRWRRSKRSYRCIQQVLAANGVKVALMTLHEFVQRRSRPRTDERHSDPTAASYQTESAPTGVKEETRLPRRSPDEIAAMRAAASVANHKPAFPREEQTRLFEYDPDRPLTNRKSS